MDVWLLPRDRIPPQQFSTGGLLKLARTRSKHFVPYHRAVEIVRDASIRSRAHYWRWYDETHPKYLPRHPHNHYTEWDSWNAFLGTTNSFDKTLERKKGEKKVYRDYYEAVRYAQQMAKQFGISTREEWERFYDDYELPVDIPKRPHHEYTKFSWNVWLGKDAVAKMKAHEENVAVFCIHSVPNKPVNVIRPMVHNNGYHSMLDKVANDDSGMLGKPYKIYFYERDDMGIVDRALHHHGHKQDDGTYIVPNMNALFYSLDNDMMIYRKG